MSAMGIFMISGGGADVISGGIPAKPDRVTVTFSQPKPDAETSLDQ